MPARSQLALRLTIEGPSERAASGQIELVLRAGNVTLTERAPFDFAGPAPDPLAGWVLVGLGATGAVAAWAFATRPKKPRDPAP